MCLTCKDKPHLLCTTPSTLAKKIVGSFCKGDVPFASPVIGDASIILLLSDATVKLDHFWNGFQPQPQNKQRHYKTKKDQSFGQK
jgi:hypothetical protein